MKYHEQAGLLGISTFFYVLYQLILGVDSFTPEEVLLNGFFLYIFMNLLIIFDEKVVSQVFLRKTKNNKRVTYPLRKAFRTLTRSSHSVQGDL